LVRETCLEALLIDLGFGPGEGLGIFVIGLDEGIDVLPELFDRGEWRVLERVALQDREPDLDLIEPGSTGRGEVEMYVGMTLEPAVVFRLMGVEIVEDDMDGGIRISGSIRIVLRMERWLIWPRGTLKITRRHERRQRSPASPPSHERIARFSESLRMAASQEGIF
jgi:hypothetical protein